MINIEALDKVIAVVVVILILSLFVQSLQSLLKKLFRIKSRQIETSLVHLFHYMLDGDALAVVSSKANNAPLWRLIKSWFGRVKHPSEVNDRVKTCYCAVEAEFRKVGRVTASGKMMLDSISKEDLLKVVERIQNKELVERVAPGLSSGLEAIEQKVALIESSVATIKTQYAAVYNSAKAQFDLIEQLIAPVVADARQIAAGQQVAANLVLSDLGKLGQLNPAQVAAVQEQIKQAIAQLSNVADAGPAIAILEALNEALNGLAKVAAGLGSIKNFLGGLSTWYDTVMQSFGERYTRGMKTWSWVISAVVVIFLNANLVAIYKEISTSDARRAVILQAADQIRTKATSQNAAGQGDAGEVQLEQWAKDALQVIKDNETVYTSLGFDGPEWIKKAYHWWPTHSWSQRLWKLVETLFGWFVMTLLLSAGAPFWEDVLESLFGVKNLVRGKSGTKNVEQDSGKGQTKP